MWDPIERTGSELSDARLVVPFIGGRPSSPQSLRAPGSVAIAFDWRTVCVDVFNRLSIDTE